MKVNHRAVQALESDEFLTMKDTEALDVALVLQQILQGQNSLLDRMNKYDKGQQAIADSVTKLKQHHAESDEAVRRWENDRAKLVDEWRGKLDAVPPDVREKAQVTAVNDVQTAMQNANAKAVADNLQFKLALASTPQVKVKRPGELVQTPTGTRLEPEVVRLGPATYVFPPDEEVEVPIQVRDQLNNRDRQRAEYDARAKVLDADNIKPYNEVERRMREIDAEYNSPTERLAA
jgi:hypothetical protein